MDIYVMDQGFNVVGVLDKYSSLIWTDRLRGYGDFEIYTPFDISILKLCKQDYYINIDYSDRTMIIEGIEILTDVDGNNLRIIGRSLESILDRRIIWDTIVIKGTGQGEEAKVEDAVRTLLNACIISPSKTDRRISNFIFDPLPSGDPLKSLTINKTQYTGDNLYDVLMEYCDAFQADGLGFKVILNDNHQFVFSLYSGVDRSYMQDVLPYVIFSPDYDNVVNTNYLDDMSTMKNITLVAGEGEDNNRKRIIVGKGVGLNRRELYTDARDLRMEDYDNDPVKYKDAMKIRGLQKLVENCRSVSYEGEVEAQRQFVYGRDFLIGDIIQIENEYGIKGDARVIEWVISDSSSGFETYPTFDGVQIINDDEEDDGGWS